MKQLLSLCSILIALQSASQGTIKQVRECIMENGTVQEVTVDYNTTTAAKSMVVNGVRKPIDEIYPNEGAEYAAKKEWFINNKNITVGGAEYKKYGLPRVLGINETQKLALYDGIQVFAEAGKTGTPEVIYLPVRRGCEFQPYQFAKECVTEIKLTPGIKEVKPGGKVVITATIPKTTDKYVYEWTAVPGTIIGDKTGKTITVQPNAGQEDDMQVSLFVTIPEGKCSGKYQYITIPVLAPRFVSKAKKLPVQVLNWGKVPTQLDTAFWSKDVELQVLKQLSSEEYQYAKTHSTYKGWSGPVRSLMDWRTYYTDKMASLKTYEVASFDVIRGGKNLGKALIIVVPYEENKAVLDSKKPLSDFYIIMGAVGIKRI